MKTLEFKDISTFLKNENKELPFSNWILITQNMITDFANATLDKQWVHIDEEKAKKDSPFGCTIAHGFMSVALLSKFLGDLIKIKSLKMGLNYGLNSVRFMNPVLVNSQLRLKSTIKVIEPHKNGIKVTFSCTVEIKGEDKPACVAEFIALFIE